MSLNIFVLMVGKYRCFRYRRELKELMPYLIHNFFQRELSNTNKANIFLNAHCIDKYAHDA